MQITCSVPNATTSSAFTNAVGKPYGVSYPGEDANAWVMGVISQRKCQQITAHRKL